MLVQSRKNGLRFNIIILAEGAKDENNNILTASTIKQVIVDRLDYDTRITVLGHIQRGGKPSAHDRILSSRLGAEAANFVYRNDGPAKPIIVAVRGNGITYLPLSDIVMRTFSITEAIKNSEYTKVRIIFNLIVILIKLFLYFFQVDKKISISTELCDIYVNSSEFYFLPFYINKFRAFKYYRPAVDLIITQTSVYIHFQHYIHIYCSLSRSRGRTYRCHPSIGRGPRVPAL